MLVVHSLTVGSLRLLGGCFLLCLLAGVIKLGRLVFILAAARREQNRNKQTGTQKQQARYPSTTEKERFHSMCSQLLYCMLNVAALVPQPVFAAFVVAKLPQSPATSLS